MNPKKTDRDTKFEKINWYEVGITQIVQMFYKQDK